MSREVRTEREFEEILGSGKKVVALFYATWCPFSQEFLPVFEEGCRQGAAGEYCRVAVDLLGGFEEEYGIQVVPTVLCFDKGEVTARLDGTPGEGLRGDELAEFIKACGAPCRGTGE